ncbi:hypothetical protein HDE78_003211 [Rhodanobacter sp. K2T2]|uniref:hypothetical protein n=1 Tax=Rhodanobacter sp. K2T2 TaxID=2723085 RepID=UPI0017F1CED8|nr:hypothetical protein [Rhodanobacter sp. K2T2]NYE30242.1 hypothetical protein [Rhodanobacter sp. K2T2]
MDYARPQYVATLYEECDGAHLFPNGWFYEPPSGSHGAVGPGLCFGRLRFRAAAE